MKRINYIIFFYAYFIAQMIYAIVNTYLPIYFFLVLNVERAELAFAQVISYSAFLLKPLYSLYIDKFSTKRKKLLISSSLIVFVSITIVFWNISILLIFGIFLGINFAFLAMIDVIIDKYVVEISEDEKTKDRNALCIQAGAFLGALMVSVLFLLNISDFYATYQWNSFFLFSLLLIVPLIALVLFLDESKHKAINPLPIHVEKGDINNRNILLMNLYIFLIYADRLYKYPIEPWLTQNFSLNATQFVMLIFVMIIINLIGLILATAISRFYDRKKILYVATGISAILTIIGPFMPWVILLIFLTILQITSGFILINLIAIMIEISKKKVVIYQILTLSMVGAIWLFIPLGTYLTLFIKTEYIIMVAGVCFLFSIVPLYFLTLPQDRITDS
ncbi:MAG: MFS transporter [Promethearchaeota archaeon]